MDRTTRIAVIVVLVVACTTGAAAAAYFAQQSRIAALQHELVRIDAQRMKLAEKVEGFEKVLAERDRQLETATSASPSADTPPTQAPTADTSTDPGSGGSDPGDSKTSAPTTRHFAFVNKAFTKGSTVWLSLDYAEFLTDPDDVKAAAQAAGDEYPPPNDYYIANPSSKLREFPVAKGAAFTIALAAPDDTKRLSPDGFLKAVRANTDQEADAGYWVTIKDNTVIAAEEQWTP